MQSQKPLITIGITCYNAEDTISQAINCAINQDWPNIEIIIVDDGSTDRSIDVINKFIEKKNTIKLFEHKQNKGFPSALNTIIHNANGKFITFFDDDDFSEPNRLTTQYQYIHLHEKKFNTNLIFCYARRKIKKNNKITLGNYSLGYKEREPYGEMVVKFLLWHEEKTGYSWGQFGSCTLMARKSTFNTIGDFDQNFRRCAEWDYAIRLAFKEGYFISVPDPLITQYINESSDKSGKIPLIYALLLRKKHADYLKKHHVYLASKMIAHARFHYAHNNRYLSIFYLALGCLLSPWKVLKSEILKRTRHVN